MRGTAETSATRILAWTLRLVPAALLAAAVWAAPWRLAVVRGGSMAPALLPGDLCVIRAGQVGGLRRGDIVLFAKEGWSGGVLHRVTGRTAGGYRTRGDANPVADLEPVPHARILGECVAVLPLGKAAAHFRRCVGGGTLPGQSDSTRR